MLRRYRSSGRLRYWIRRFTAPFARFRARRTLRRGRVGDEQHARVSAAWWGGDPRWFPGGTPPRAQNRVVPLIDGERFFSALHKDLLAAQHYVYVAGWSFTPELPLLRGSMAQLEDSRLLSVLGDLAKRLPVRLLVWSGSVFLFQPTTAVAEAAQETMQRLPGDLGYLLDRCSQPTHTQHQKAIVIDGRIAYVGGMDLTTYQGDRWDTPEHPLRAGPNWHDVQLRIEGEAAADVEANFRQRWGAAGGDPLPAQQATSPDAAWQMPVQIVRTIPQRTYPFAPHGEYGIHHAYLRALRGAKRQIYLENQYLWSPQIMDVLLALLVAPPDPRFRIVLVLPAQAEDGKFDNDQHVAQLRDADGGRGLVEIYCPYTCGIGPGQRAFTYRPIYLHAKVAIIDDAWCIVGSANLNDRGLLSDTELNAVVRDADLARAMRLALWSEHLGMPVEELADGDPTTLIDDLWTARAAANLAIMRGGDRPLVGRIRRYETGKMPGAWVIDEAQALTLEH